MGSECQKATESASKGNSGMSHFYFASARSPAISKSASSDNALETKFLSPLASTLEHTILASFPGCRLLVGSGDPHMHPLPTVSNGQQRFLLPSHITSMLIYRMAF
jgi:hypothetical protein